MKFFRLRYFVCIVYFVSFTVQAGSAKTIHYYNKDGVKFSYPVSWLVTKDKQVTGMRYIIVRGPSSAVFLVQIYASAEALRLKEYVTGFNNNMKKAGKFLNPKTNSLRPIDGPKNLKKGIRRIFSMRLVFITVPHFADYYRVQGKKKTAFIISQSATMTYYKVQADFKMLQSSFEIE